MKSLVKWAACLMLMGTTAVSAQEVPSRNSEAVVATVQSYVDAFNRRDAAAVSQHWAADGEMIDDEGNLLTGPNSIRQSFEALFAGMDSEQRLSVTINRISFVTDDVAMEEGTAEVEGGWKTQYVATHKKESGVWKIHSVRESAMPETQTHYQHLKPLEWMIGDWIDRDEGASIETSCHWSRNRNFIMVNFLVSVPGMDPLEGTQIIGYDASEDQIRSWMFDSDGGTGQGTWTREGEQWRVDSVQVTADGRKASQTNVYEVVDPNRFAWQSMNRRLGDEELPDSPKVLVKRRSGRER